MALALSMPEVSAEPLMWLAWSLQATLPGVGGLLASGELTLAKARAVDTALANLADEDAAKAAAMILPDLPGKTYGQVEKLAQQAAITVEPESSTRRREDAERHKPRVTMFREESGAAGLSGRDMPTDQTLAAHAKVCARAQQYRDSGAFDRDTRMDQFRVAAYLDLLNGITAAARITSGELITTTVARPGSAPDPGTNAGCGATADRAGAPGGNDRACACRECDGSCQPPAGKDDAPGDENGPDDIHWDGTGPDDIGPVSGGPGDIHPGDIGLGGHGPGVDGPVTGSPAAGTRGGGSPDGFRGDADGGHPRGGPANEGAADGATSFPPSLPSRRLADLVLPLVTLLGLGERPGESHGLGPLGPGLAVNWPRPLPRARRPGCA